MPSWFDESIRQVLAHRRVLMLAKCPRELEQATAELLGEQLHRALRSRDFNLYFDWWFGELATTVLTRTGAPTPPGDPDQSTWWLLQGLLALAPTDFLIPPVQDFLDAATGQCEPPWLPLSCRVQATGDIWQLTAAEQTRLGIIAGYEYPGGADQHVYLFDVETCSPMELLGADTFDTVEQATRAWCTTVGPGAAKSRPTVITDPASLAFLPYCCDLTHVTGLESRNRLDNWFRAARRIEELMITLRRLGTPVPPIPPAELMECR
ncbi:hypothetical protein GFY24_32415 [Nocardia sp. SYP-A9097]|uniref:hypothetical protein n=1 Tax=Nocardia sp. SYP-A9097 TaxID=2663237 RepID=UPI00129BA4B5|nr:hypothetical protein [Nocardia sp. SYP-A9097]MRH92090.1 hypothetical protein [Nocardia sp. SYP-A9097]